MPKYDLVFYRWSKIICYLRKQRCGAYRIKECRYKEFLLPRPRHTFASHLVKGGVDLTTVKELLGHKTLTMTLRYSHLAPSHNVKAVDMLDSAITGKPTIQKLYDPEKKELVINA